MEMRTVYMYDYTEFCGVRVSPLAIALAEHPEWRWREGMVGVTDTVQREGTCLYLRDNPFVVTGGTRSAGEAPSSWVTDGYDCGGDHVPGKAVPQIFDPGMIGWLLWILQQYLPYGDVFPPRGEGQPWRAIVVNDDDTFRVVATAPSAGEALAAAILLMWGVEIVHGTSGAEGDAVKAPADFDPRVEMT